MNSRGQLWRSFETFDRYHHPIQASLDLVEDGTRVVRVGVGGNREQATKLTADQAEALIDHLRVLVTAVRKGPTVRPVQITEGPPPPFRGSFCPPPSGGED